jgi:hypothetical protein
MNDSRFERIGVSYAMEAIVSRERNLGRGVDATPVPPAHSSGSGSLILQEGMGSRYIRK